MSDHLAGWLRRSNSCAETELDSGAGNGIRTRDSNFGNNNSATNLRAGSPLVALRCLSRCALSVEEGLRRVQLDPNRRLSRIPEACVEVMRSSQPCHSLL